MSVRAIARRAAARSVRALAPSAAPGRGTGAPRRRPKVLRYAFDVAETGFDPAQISDLYSRIAHAAHLRGAVQLRPPGAAGQDQAAHGGGMPEVSADFRTWTVKIRPGIFFADDPAFKGKQRELVAQDYVYSLKRFADPANKSPAVGQLRDRRHRRPERAAPSRRCDQRSRSTTTARSRACARSTATRCSSSWPSRARASSRPWPAATCSAPWRARSSSSTATQIEEHPVGTGPFRLGAVAAQLVHRARAQPRLPRGALRRRARRRRRRGPGAARALQGPARCRWSTGSRSRSSRRSSRAGCRSSTARPTSLERVPLRVHRRRRCPNGKVAPNLAKRGMQRLRGQVEPDGTLLLLQHGGPGRRRLHAGARSRCAARSASASTSQREIATRSTRPGASPAQAPLLPHTDRLRPGPSAARSASTTRRAPRRCSTCTATSTATATAGASCPTARRWCSSRDASPTSARASIDELWSKNIDAIGVRVRLRSSRSGPRT